MTENAPCPTPDDCTLFLAPGAERNAVGVARAPSSALVAWSGERAAFRTVEFLTAGIGNPHTRRAYTRAAKRFLAWCNARGMTLADVKSPDVALYIQELGGTLAPLSVKQHLAALKHWFDWLVTGHMLEVNPAHSVRQGSCSVMGSRTAAREKAGFRTQERRRSNWGIFRRSGSSTPCDVANYRTDLGPDRSSRQHEVVRRQEQRR